MPYTVGAATALQAVEHAGWRGGQDDTQWHRECLRYQYQLPLRRPVICVTGREALSERSLYAGTSTRNGIDARQETAF